jgi:hypothetical protein
MSLSRFQIFTGILLIAVASVLKVLTFPYSINPIIAISFFSGVLFKNKKWAFTMPLLAMFFSDCLMELYKDGYGFYGLGQVGNYLSLLSVTLLGTLIQQAKPGKLIIGSVSSSLLFFLLSNTNVFLFDNLLFYGTGFIGWINCLVAGIPFLERGVLTDLSFVAVLFTAHHYISSLVLEKKITAK